MQYLQQLLSNQVLIAALIAWTTAQVLKLPMDYILNKKWDWRVLWGPGGMPSSHTAIATASSLAIGLYHGFHTPLFALSITLTLIVVYDATNVRRQAGIHAKWINLLVEEIITAPDTQKKKLREVLGHTPFEAIMGVILGITVTMLYYWLIR